MEKLFKKIANGVVKEEELKEYFNSMVNSINTIGETKYKLEFGTIDNGGEKKFWNFNSKTNTYTIDIAALLECHFEYLYNKDAYNIKLLNAVNMIISSIETKKMVENSILDITEPEVFVCLANESLMKGLRSTPISEHYIVMKTNYYTEKVLENSLDYGLDYKIYSSFVSSANNYVLDILNEESNNEYSLLERSMKKDKTPKTIAYSYHKTMDTADRIEYIYSKNAKARYINAAGKIIDRNYISTNHSYKDQHYDDYASLTNRVFFGKHISKDEVKKLANVSESMSILDYLMKQQESKKTRV